MDHFVNISIPDFKKAYKKEMDSSNKKSPVPYGSMLHILPTNLLLLAAKQEPCKNFRSLSPNEKHLRIFWKKFRRMNQQAEKKKTERVTGLSRRTREEIVKWNQMTALTSDIPSLHSRTLCTSLRTSCLNKNNEYPLLSSIRK